MKAGVYLALLRGVNLGGKNKLPMKDLTRMFSEAGCSEVRTYIQSGNVVYRASEALARRVPDLITAVVAKRFGFQAPIVIRTAEELVRIARGNPFLKAGAEEDTLHVAFLADRPPRALVAELDPDRSPPDRFEVRGSEIYLHCPLGYGRSKLTNQYFDGRLRTTSTVRNWRTVQKLIEMTRKLP